MKQAALSHFDMPWLPTTALIIFLVCFAVYTYWTFKKENKEMYDRASMLPIEENQNETRN